MKRFKQGLALILALALCMSLLAVPAAASTGDNSFGGSTLPIVLIHGNTQSDVFLYEDDNITRVLDDDGMPANNMRVERYVDANGIPQSLAECPEDMRDAVNKRLRIAGRDPRIKDEQIYYFAYDSFGNNVFNTKARAGILIWC